tara:strand:- start:9 stop:971 length:963 start_codon:yes stop_codon:yes gene_type:complete
MSNIESIIEAIDNYLKKENKLEATPTELSPYLHKIGVLKDSESRKGKPLRDLLRKNKIPQAYQNGSRWIIPRSNSNFKNSQKIIAKNTHKLIEITSNKKAVLSKDHKLLNVAILIKTELEKKYESKAEYILEYKPEWLRTYPNKENLNNYWDRIQLIYEDLTDKKFDLEINLKNLEQSKLNARQSFDIWFNEPYNLAIEFDEKQHFNIFRKKTLAYYEDLEMGFNLNDYQKLNERIIKSGKSGFTKLKSNDPLFPEMNEGDNQDNRIRQRAFRDYLKDISPLAQGFKPTVRIPYSITNGSIKDFSKEELMSIKRYIQSYI